MPERIPYTTRIEVRVPIFRARDKDMIAVDHLAEALRQQEEGRDHEGRLPPIVLEGTDGRCISLDELEGGNGLERTEEKPRKPKPARKRKPGPQEAPQAASDESDGPEEAESDEPEATFEGGDVGDEDAFPSKND